MGLKLENKCALITGGGRGIGLGIARRFLQDGARVAIVDVVADRVNVAAETLGEFGEAYAIVADLSRASGCVQAAAEAKAALGRIDVLVNNAGVVRVKQFLDATEDDWDFTMAVNAKAQFLLGQQVSRIMIEQGGGGVIINASSTNGFMAERNSTTYDSSKGAAVMLTQAMALDLSLYGIRVVGVAPGLAGPTDLAIDGGVSRADINIDRTNARVPIGRMATVEEVANVYAFLASDEASHVAGTTVVVDGALTSRQFGDGG